jgi:hypothetical protein
MSMPQEFGRLRQGVLKRDPATAARFKSRGHPIELLKRAKLRSSDLLGSELNQDVASAQQISFVAPRGEMEGTMGHLFWLSVGAWAAIQPHLPTNQPGAHESMTGGSSAAFFMFSRRVAAGAIARRTMVVDRRAILALNQFR